MAFEVPITSYLLRATYDWIVDAGFTPYTEIDTSCPRIEIPPQFSNEKSIILNIAPQAVSKLRIDNQVIEFDARFGSQINHLFLPIPAIIAIYARENGFGMQFIPTIEYLGENIELTDFSVVQKFPTIEKISQSPTKSDIRSRPKPKLTLITKEKAKENSDPEKKS